MSDERDALRFAARRAALHDALRSGDAIVAARAASRLRVDGFPMAPSEFARARVVRHALGLALVKARMPRTNEPPLRREAAIAAPQATPRWRLVAALAAATLVVLVIIFGNGVSLNPSGGSPPQAAAPAQQQQITVLANSRGRTITLPLDQVAVKESPTPAPTEAATPAPTEAPTTAPSRTSGTGSGTSTGTPGPTGSGTGGGGSGGGGGIGIIPRPTPTPFPTVTPPVPPPGFGRFSVIVFDNATGRPLPDVCVVIGTQTCGPNAPHTDANGRWSADVPVTSGTTYWEMYFIKAGYVTSHRTLTLASGATVTFSIFMRRQF